MKKTAKASNPSSGRAKGGLSPAKKILCPVCGGNTTDFKYTIVRHGFDVWLCAGCKSEFRHPLPRKADAYYDEGYYTGTAAFNYQDERKQEYYHNFVHRARLNNIRRFLSTRNSMASGNTVAGITSASPRPKFLDVGCAFGAFVRAAAHDFDAAGLDVSDFAVREGNKICATTGSSAKLYQGDLTHLPKERTARDFFAPGTISAITLIEVAEHLQAPRPALTQAYRLLRPGGVLVIQTANFEGLQAVQGGSAYHYYLPGHLVYYTATGLRQMLAEIGVTEFREFCPVDFSLWAKWRKAWGDVRKFSDLKRFWNMSIYHLKSKLRRGGRPLTSSYALYARKSSLPRI